MRSAETGGAQVAVDHDAARRQACRSRAACSRCHGTGASALALILTNGQATAAQREAERALGAAENENRELRAILDTATDGVLTLDAEGRIVGANARAAALFGKAGERSDRPPFDRLLAPESERAARDYFERIVRGSSTLNQRPRRDGAHRRRPAYTPGDDAHAHRRRPRLRRVPRRHQPQAGRGRTAQRQARGAAGGGRRRRNSSPRSATRSARRSTP